MEIGSQETSHLVFLETRSHLPEIAVIGSLLERLIHSGWIVPQEDDYWSCPQAWKYWSFVEEEERQGRPRPERGYMELACKTPDGRVTIPVGFDAQWFQRALGDSPDEFTVFWVRDRESRPRHPAARWPFAGGLDGTVSGITVFLRWSADYVVDPDLTEIDSGEERQLFGWRERWIGHRPRGMGVTDPNVFDDSSYEGPIQPSRVRRSRIVPVIRCRCGRRLTYAPREGINPRVRRTCPRCRRIFDPSADPYRVKNDPDGPAISLFGGTFYRFQLEFAFWASIPDPLVLRLRADYLQLLKEVLGSELRELTVRL